MRRLFFPLCFGAALFIILSEGGCRKPELLTDDDYNEWLSGGSQTVFDAGSGAYSHPFPGLSGTGDFNHGVGDAAFEATFVSAPAPVRPGLGPVFNSVSCVSCHVADGRGKPPGPNEQLLSMLFRISIPGQDPHGGPNPVPGFGGQLQQRSIVTTFAEASVDIQYTEQTYYFTDGTPYQLRVPTYTIQNPYIPLPGGVMLSPRVAPPVFGLGLLEAVSEADILRYADEYDSDGNGISGRPNRVWDAVKKETVLGRFGWKCGAPNLLQQSAGAYNEDMGITNFIFPVESSYGQLQYDQLDDETEVSDSLLYAASFYVRTLAVPGRRDAEDADVLRGRQLFQSAGCASCHVPRYRTRTDVSFPQISGQVIFPYSDMLLHDMGPGLSDNRPDFLATGNEWRTPPLWGIGLTGVVNGHQNFLHDGRARSLSEAILWHGGEAENAKERFRSMNAAERQDLLRFLESL